MIERDYILRMIQMLTTALAKVLFHKDLKQYDEALLEIDLTAERFLGARWKFLCDLSDQQLIELLGSRGQQEKMLAAAELLCEGSDILNEQGKVDESVGQGMKAFSLFAELIIEEKNYLTAMSVDKFTMLLKRLEQFDLPLPVQQKRFRYYEAVGEFAKAEDAVFDLIEKDPSIVQQGIAFYERLLKKSDGELVRGGLPRNEVVEGLAKIKSMEKAT